MKLPQTIGVLVVASLILITGIVVAIIYSGSQPNTTDCTMQYFTYTIVQTYPHNSSAFTEGLTFADGALYESTGLYGSSTLRKIDLETGNILKEIVLPDQHFGEGMTIVNDRIIQLTYKEHVGFVYDKTTFSQVDTFSYITEGWGLTFDGNRLIMSDGSSNLYFLDPVTYQNTGHVTVNDGNVSITSINELEYVKGDVYANIWMQKRIAIINPENGQVKAWIDLSDLESSSPQMSENVLNGIAYDAQNDRLFITGKNWPDLFEIKLIPQNST